MEGVTRRTHLLRMTRRSVQIIRHDVTSVKPRPCSGVVSRRRVETREVDASGASVRLFWQRGRGKNVRHVVSTTPHTEGRGVWWNVERGWFLGQVWQASTALGKIGGVGRHWKLPTQRQSCSFARGRRSGTRCSRSVCQVHSSVILNPISLLLTPSASHGARRGRARSSFE